MAGNDELIRAIRAAVAREQPANLGEAQVVLERLQAEHNRAPRAEFDGLSPEQMAALLYVPFEAPEAVSFAGAVPPDTEAPILALYGRIADAIGHDGLKATAKGNLPRKLVREAAFAYFPEDANLERHVFREEDFMYLHGVRLMAGLAGLIRKRHGKFLLTVKGRKLHDAHGPAGAYPALFETFARKFNWGYWDGYPPARIVQEAFLFSLRLLSRYGDTPRSQDFYADAFLRAFPMMLDEVEDQAFRSREELARLCYTLRTFRTTGLLGLTEQVDGKERRLVRDDEALVRKRPLLDTWIRFRV